MPVFEIALEDGRKLRVDAEDQQAALAGVQHYLTQNSAPNDSPSESYADALRQGAANVAGGIGETIEQYAGKSAASDALKGVAEKVRPENYSPAQVIASDGVTPSNLPRAVVEQAPGMAAGIAAARVAGRVSPKLALPAAALAYLGLTRGDEAKRSAETRTGQEGAEPTAQDKARSVLYGIPESILAAVGAKRFLPGVGRVGNVGAKGVAESGKQLAKTAAVEGGVGSGQSAIAQAGRTVGTDGGLNVDPYEVANSGLVNAATGGTLAAPRAMRSAGTAVKFREFGGENAEAAVAVANRIQQAADGNLRNTSVAGKAVRDASLDIHNELRESVKGLDNLSQETKNALDRVKAGTELSKDALRDLQSSSIPESVKSLAQQASVIERLKTKGIYREGENARFKGGLSSKLDETVRILRNPAAVGVTAGLGGAGLAGAGGATGAFVVPGIGTIGAILGGYGTARLIDRFTGARSPAKRFVDQFADDAVPVRPAQQARETEEPLPFGPWNMPPTPHVGGIGGRPVAPFGPWNQPPKPNVAGFGTRPVSPDLQAEAKYNPRSNLIVEEGMARVAKELRKDKRKTHVADAQAALKKLAALQKPVDLPEDFRLGSQAAVATALPKDVLEAAKLAGFKMKVRDKSNALEAKGAAAQEKAAGERAAEAIAETSPLLAEVGGLDAVRNPAVGKRAGSLVAAANAIKKLTAEPKGDDGALAPDELPALKPPRTTKVTKGDGKVEQETDTGEYVPPRSVHADLEPAAAADRILQAAKEGGKSIKYPAGFKAATIRNIVAIRSAASALEAETGIPRKDIAAQFEGITRNGDPVAHREWLKAKYPEYADNIQTHFNDEMIARIWLRKRTKKKS